jgi:hypothetical protein
MEFFHDPIAGEDSPTFEVSDEALEAAACSMTVKAGAFTMAFCSGINTCPSIQITSALGRERLSHSEKS